MKTIYYIIAVCAASFFMSTNVSAQYSRPYPDNRYQNNQQQSFYYYPQSNVYCSMATGQYIFYDRNGWLVSNRLPHRIRLRREPRFVVNHYGFDVWNDNRYHVMKFRDNGNRQPDMVYDRHNHDDHDDRYDDHRPDDRRHW